MNIYIFQWISNLGGADTRLKELIQLFSKNKNYKMFIIPNDNERVDEKDNVEFLKNNNVKILSWENLPKRAEGVGISFSNFRLFSESWRIEKIKSIGLKFIWSNDMIWREASELKAFQNKMIDISIYTNNYHYKKMTSEIIQTSKEMVVPNFFYLKNYPYIERYDNKNVIYIGKHSRPDDLKFSDNFPLFYKHLNLQNPNYRVMGFTEDLKNRFKWFKFGNEWNLLKPNQEKTLDFLKSLDIYIYNSHYKFAETQCRTSIEAMLTGLPVIAPFRNNFSDQIWNTKSGFLWKTYEECQTFAKILEKNFYLRKEMGKLAREISINLWCDEEKHNKLWENIFYIL